MHSWHFEPNWAFHANGDPIPGDVIINQYGNERPIWGPQFRTTAEEITTFVMAVKLGAALDQLPIVLATTHFTLDGDNVTLRARDKADFRDADDSTEMVVPYVCLLDFTTAIVERRYQLYLESRRTDEVMAAIGVFVLLTSGDSK